MKTQRDPSKKLSSNFIKEESNSHMFTSPKRNPDQPPAASTLTTEMSMSPGRARKSVMFPKYFNTEESWQMTLSLKKEKELARKVQEKKYYYELKQLVKERTKFRSALVQTRDVKSLELLSKKILKVNQRITRIMKKISGEEFHLLGIRGSALEKGTQLPVELEIIDFSAMKDDLKKIDNYLRVNDLIFEGKVMDMKQNLQIKKKTSYFFQRPKSGSLYEPSTDLGRNTKTRNRNTLFQKGYRPYGFRTARDQKSPPLVPTTFEDVLYQYEERSKSQRRDKEKDDKKERPMSDIRAFETETTYRNKTEASEPKCTVNKYKSKRHQRIATACTVQKDTDKVLTNTKIIQESIKMTIKEDKKTARSNNYKKLLLLLAKKLEKPIKQKKKAKEKEYDQKQVYTDRLGKVPKSAKPIFRKVFKTILSEDIHLNKQNPLAIDPYDQKIQYIKRQKDFQKQANKNMYLMKEQSERINDDDEVFKDIKIFDNYGNLDSLEWLMKKRNALKSDRKLVGAYNPREKAFLAVNYKDI